MTATETIALLRAAENDLVLGPADRRGARRVPGRDRRPRLGGLRARRHRPRPRQRPPHGAAADEGRQDPYPRGPAGARRATRPAVPPAAPTGRCSGPGRARGSTGTRSRGSSAGPPAPPGSRPPTRSRRTASGTPGRRWPASAAPRWRNGSTRWVTPIRAPPSATTGPGQASTAIRPTWSPRRSRSRSDDAVSDGAADRRPRRRGLARRGDGNVRVRRHLGRTGWFRRLCAAAAHRPDPDDRWRGALPPEQLLALAAALAPHARGTAWFAIWDGYRLGRPAGQPSRSRRHDPAEVAADEARLRTRQEAFRATLPAAAPTCRHRRHRWPYHGLTSRVRREPRPAARPRRGGRRRHRVHPARGRRDRRPACATCIAGSRRA